MLQAVNWNEKLGQLGRHSARVLRILVLFVCALGILVVIYRARGARIQKEQKLQDLSNAKKNPLNKVAINLSGTVSTKWVIVGNPDADNDGGGGGGVGAEYVCSVANVANGAGWKTIIIGDKLECCRMPECYPITKGQFLRMSYKTASVLKNLMESGQNPQVYKEAIRNLAYIWVMHRGARHVFDAYVDEYIAAKVPIPKFEEEVSRQLHTLALDESLALVEDRSRGRGSLFQNPYSHFGRPDVRLLPGGPGGPSEAIHHTPQSYTGLHLAHHRAPPMSHQILNSSRPQDFPSFRICEVRPPSIEKFLEIDGGWWDMRAPALVLPGDTMPPLCTRNTLFSPDVFWALPLLPDYATTSGNEEEIKNISTNSSRIPPWYIRGLWSQSLLGDLGGSIRLTLSRVPTLQMNQTYFAGVEAAESSDAEKNPSKNFRTSKLLKRWHCRSRSAYQCLMLMSTELAKSVYLRKNDLQIVKAWISDLQSIHYAEPPMLPKRRSHTNPCLGVDGLPGVSFFPALEPNGEFLTEEFIGKRNDTLKALFAQSSAKADSSRDRRDAMLDRKLTPPEENSTYYPVDWSTKTPSTDDEPSVINAGGESEAKDSYYSRDSMKEPDEMMDMLDSLGDHSVVYPRRTSAPFADKLVGGSAYTAAPNDPRTAYWTSVRSAKLLPMKSGDSKTEEYPILKAITESTCPGFGPLIPYQPKVVHDDILLIVVFTGKHYDFIPMLEVLYRQSFPNILYCGPPNNYVDAFLQKYQTAEHRSFSFLPTYTKATYECVLGAIEMNYEVKGYAVITDETLMQTWNLDKLDKSKIWVSNSKHDTRHVPVNRTSWNKLDPRGHKLPRLLEGIINTWKLFSYILAGQEIWIQDPKIIKKRSLDSEEILEPAAASYIPVQSGEPLWTQATPENKTASTEADSNGSGERKNSLQGDSETKGWERADLSVSDWDNIKDQQGSFTGLESISVRSNGENNSTNSTSTSTSDVETEDVEVGEEDDESSIAELELIPTESVASSSPPSYDTSDASTTTDESDSVILATPTPETDNFTASVDSTASEMSTTPAPESSVGVPLYHVEHTEPPTPSTYHKPEEVSVSTEVGSRSQQNDSLPLVDDEKIAPLDVPSSSSSLDSKGDSKAEDSSPVTKSPNGEVFQGLSSSNTPGSDPVPTTPVPEKNPSSSTTQGASHPTTTGGSSEAVKEKAPHPSHDDGELKKDMDMLLDTLQKIYMKMREVVAEYNGTNNNGQVSGSKESSGEVAVGHEPVTLDDTQSHRISPREFRHIRCSLQDHGHQSDICSTLRNYITTLGQNLGEEIELDHDTIPMYYLPAWTTKPFYSVANVLLHFKVMDELALPLLFKGLAVESDWAELTRSPSLRVSPKDTPLMTEDSSVESREVTSNPQDAQYLHPFNLHKVKSFEEKRQLFCSNYLLKVFQM